ncbi:MAG: hypothetical protein J6C44_04065 [Muribaculaceae bacterium]|nr:hypothetical protein [Muribaculaceae bacterium]
MPTQRLDLPTPPGAPWPTAHFRRSDSTPPRCRASLGSADVEAPQWHKLPAVIRANSLWSGGASHCIAKPPRTTAPLRQTVCRGRAPTTHVLRHRHDTST